MTTLRITQRTSKTGDGSIELSLEQPSYARQSVHCDFNFTLNSQDQEDLRWYLEDFLENPVDPAPQSAARIEARMSEIGRLLFAAIFHANNDARDLWTRIKDDLHNIRIEIDTTISAGYALPWELLRDDTANTVLALTARSFVRMQSQTIRSIRVTPAHGLVRVLMVISRPSGPQDVPYRSVAGKLIKNLSQQRDNIRFDVLRPATFERLATVLRDAKLRGEPYQILHFDGHGSYLDVAALAMPLSDKQSLLLRPFRSGAHGYLAFENPVVNGNTQLVDGPALAQLLLETEVAALVLNACRSAHAESAPSAVSSLTVPDPHTQAEAYGSLAQEVTDAGVPAVIAMRYNVYVVTAAQFIANLYDRLAAGDSIGEAASRARKQLADAPLRAVWNQLIRMQDWLVPIVYEATSLTLVPPSSRPSTSVEIKLNAPSVASAKTEQMLPSSPDVGFFGRDDVVLAIDRFFDSHSAVLVFGYAGSGKTSVLVEFARWYLLTGGTRGPVIYSDFSGDMRFLRLLDELANAFKVSLQFPDIHWDALAEPQKVDIALQLLSQSSFVWLWDNFDAAQNLLPAEQEKYLSFLQRAKSLKARFLIASRRDERSWLGNVVIPLKISPMPMQERAHLAKAIGARSGKPITDIVSWWSLLEYSGGNPLAITVLVGQAVREGVIDRQGVTRFVEQVEKSQLPMTDPDLGVLTASLRYSLDHGFQKKELKQIALLHLFTHFVHANDLCLMGHVDAPWMLDAVKGLTSAESYALLERVADTGLLDRDASRWYRIHPVLPAFFARLYNRFYPSGDARRSSAEFAFRGTMTQVAHEISEIYFAGNGDRLHPEMRGATNLESALSLSVAAKDAVRSTILLGAFSIFYRRLNHFGERCDALLHRVRDAFPVFACLTAPPLKKEDGEPWKVVALEYAQMALRQGRSNESEPIQKAMVEFARKRMETAVASGASSADRSVWGSIEDFGIALAELGQTQFHRENIECLDNLQSSFSHLISIGQNAAAAITASYLVDAYQNGPGWRDYDKAAFWAQKILDLRADARWTGKAHLMLAELANEQGQDLYFLKQPEKRDPELDTLLATVFQHASAAVSVLPENEHSEIARAHFAIASVYFNSGQLSNGLKSTHNSIRAANDAGELNVANKARLGAAKYLFLQGRLNEAAEYVEANIRMLEGVVGPSAEAEEYLRSLLSKIRDGSVSAGDFPTLQTYRRSKKTDDKTP